MWTPQLHRRFTDAVAHLCLKNVASHFQNFRLYMKRMQGLSNGSGCDPATDHLVALPDK